MFEFDKLNFCSLGIISGSAEAINGKFCKRIEGKGYQTKNKNGQNGRGLGHVTYF